jgi:alkaline phosphatase
MKLTMKALSAIVAFAFLITGCAGSSKPATSSIQTIQPTLTPEPTPTKIPLEKPASLETSRVRNIILFIGDGMGENHRIAATWLSQSQDGILAMDAMTYSGWAMTKTAYDQVTDSAASATAIATGVKTANNRIGIDTRGRPLTTILDHARELGMATGLITTVHISHATPAAFVSHVQSRDDMLEISAQMMDVGVNVLMGGGENEFLPEDGEGCYSEPGKRKDGRNLINEAIEMGYRYICSAGELIALDPLSTTHLLGLFADEELLRPYQPSLSEMTEMAISILRQDPDGFFLMVEGGQIDWASHGWNAVDAMVDALGLDEAVAVAKEFAAEEHNTLIIVTADHETGGMKLKLLPEGLTGGRDEFVMPDETAFKVSWSTSSHTDLDIPTTALGPGAELLEGTYENTHIYEVMRAALWLP